MWVFSRMGCSRTDTPTSFKTDCIVSEATPDQIAEKVRARDEETSRGRRPAYLLLVVGLATLVGGLIVSGRLRPTYTAQARVAVRDADSTPEILDRLKRDLASEQNIERTVRDGLGSVRKMVFPHERDARAAFAQAASEIEITRLSGSGRDGLVASVELREDDPWESALILNALVRQLLADRATGDNGASADALAQAANATDRARRQLAEAQARLDGQLQWHVEQSRAQAEKSAAS